MRMDGMVWLVERLLTWIGMVTDREVRKDV